MSPNTMTGVATAERFVYHFAEATHLDASVLGGKGAGVVQMTASGFPVPPGFIIATAACGASKGGALTGALWQEIVQAVHQLKARTGCGFGKEVKPLLVSVRSGATVSMPGMMDTVLNLVVAVFESWNSRRAVRYREHHKIARDLGTAVVVQQMVFGNLGRPSGTGVAFTRDPRDGSPKLFGEYLENGQDADIVAGTHTPESLDVVGRRHPDLIARLESLALAQTYHDVLDIEFTVPEGVLYLLQVRAGKRTAEAAIWVASDLFQEGVIDREIVLQRVTADHLRQVLRPQFLPETVESARTGNVVVVVGSGASPGQVSGRIVLDPDRAEQMASCGEPIILMRVFTSPRDLRGMLAIQAIVTAREGATSQAAVARALDKPCSVGCEQLDIDTERRVVRVGERDLAEGMFVSIDGATGEVFEGTLPTDTNSPESMSQLGRILQIADEISGCTIFHRVSTPDMAREAIAAGAQGIGTRIDEILAAFEGFGTLVDAVSAYMRGATAANASTPAAREEVISELLVRVMKVVHPKPFAARIANLSSGVAGEAVSDFTDTAPSPAIWLPLDSPQLLHAQIRGLLRAKEISDYPDNVIVMIVGFNAVSEKVVRFFSERGFRNFGVDYERLGGYPPALGRLASQAEAFGMRS